MSSSVLRDLRDAIRGAPHDFTTGSIGRAIFLLAVPMVLEMAMESLFAVADVFWCGRLGPDAVATVGLAETMMILVYTIAMGLGIAASALIARRIGAGEKDEASRTAVQALALGFAIALVLSLTGAVCARQILTLMGGSPEVIRGGTFFTRVMLGGSFTAFLLFVVNSSFRAAGDPSVSMVVLWIANGINMTLGPLLIFGVGPFPRFGLAGAAIATTIGRGTGVLLGLGMLARGRGHLAVRRAHLVLEPKTMLSLIKLSLSGTFQILIGSLNWIALVRLMATFGSTAMAGYTICIRLVIFALLPAEGLANAASTLVGQALGAKNPERASQAAWTAARYNVIFLGLTGGLYIFGGPLIMRFFTDDPAVREVAIYGMRVVCLGFPFFGFGMVLTQAFNGAGDTVTPTLINIGILWVFQIPLAALLVATTSLGLKAIFLSVLAAYSLLAVVSGLLFQRGRWKLRQV